MLFERKDVPGGHARTTSVEFEGGVAHASDGFNWFSDAMYPRFLRLLELIEQPTQQIPMTCSFSDQRGTLCMPPVGAGRLGRVLSRPQQLLTLLKMWRTVSKAAPLVHGKRHEVTAAEFCDQLKLGRGFIDDFLAPLISGVWGCPWERTRDCSIYPLMKYIVFHAPIGLGYYWWHIVEGGAAAYARNMAGRLANTQLQLGTPIRGVERTAQGFEVRTAEGVQGVDRLVIAAGARDAARVLEGAQGLDRQKAALARFEYYLAHVATHSDPSYMPARRKDWCVTNIRWDGARSDLTVWSGFQLPKDPRPRFDLFTSYVDPGEQPRDTHHRSAFWLPLETPDHFAAQAGLAALQGEDGLHFAGDYTQDIGSHEDAICSAIRVAEALAPQAQRLLALKQDRSAEFVAARAPKPLVITPDHAAARTRSG